MMREGPRVVHCWWAVTAYAVERQVDEEVEEGKAEKGEAQEGEASSPAARKPVAWVRPVSWTLCFQLLGLPPERERWKMKT